MDLLKTYKELGGDEIVKGYNEIAALVREAQRNIVKEEKALALMS